MRSVLLMAIAVSLIGIDVFSMENMALRKPLTRIKISLLHYSREDFQVIAYLKNEKDDMQKVGDRDQAFDFDYYFGSHSSLIFHLLKNETIFGTGQIALSNIIETLDREIIINCNGEDIVFRATENPIEGNKLILDISQDIKSGELPDFRQSLIKTSKAQYYFTIDSVDPTIGQVFKSKVLKGEIRYNDLCLDLNQICGGDLSSGFKITLYQVMGNNSIFLASNDNIYPKDLLEDKRLIVLNRNSIKNNDSNNPVCLVVDSILYRIEHSFLSYFCHGWRFCYVFIGSESDIHIDKNFRPFCLERIININNIDELSGLASVDESEKRFYIVIYKNNLIIRDVQKEKLKNIPFELYPVPQSSKFINLKNSFIRELPVKFLSFMKEFKILP